MVRDLLATKRVEDASETVASRRPTGLAEWFSASRYLPEGIMLDTLAEVDSELADRHRREGSGKQAILRDVRARVAAKS
jgi:hypothetical protein